MTDIVFRFRDFAFELRPETDAAQKWMKARFGTTQVSVGCCLTPMLKSIAEAGLTTSCEPLQLAVET